MEFNHIIALVPDGEHFDAAAINEGVWISQGHLVNIESAFAQVDSLEAQANENIEKLNGRITEMEEAATAATTTIQQKDERIAELEAEVASLKAQPAADLKDTSKQNDELEGKKEFVSEVTREAERLRALRSKK